MRLEHTAHKLPSAALAVQSGKGLHRKGELPEGMEWSDYLLLTRVFVLWFPQA